jgi:membrane protein insertase Oxa1/YidC/SpoIIIJ
VLYWLVNNVATIAQQWAMKRGATPPADADAGGSDTPEPPTDRKGGPGPGEPIPAEVVESATATGSKGATGAKRGKKGKKRKKKSAGTVSAGSTR